MKDEAYSFWHWFFKGYSLEDQQDIRSGFRQIFWNKMTLIHLIIGLLLSCIIKLSLEEVSSVLLAPLLSIIVGLTIAWVGSSLSLFTSDEIYKLYRNRLMHYVNFLYMYPAILLLVLTTLVLWILPSLFVIPNWKVSCKSITFEPLLLVKLFLYSMLSLSVRECWQSILGTYLLLVSHINVKHIDDESL